MAFNSGDKGNPFRVSFFSLEELRAYVPAEADAFRQVHSDAVLIGWNLPSYLSAPLNWLVNWRMPRLVAIIRSAVVPCQRMTP